MTVLLFGIALLVLPGPAFIVIPIGLTILASEFAWARRTLRMVRESTEKGAEKLGLSALFPRLAALLSRKPKPGRQETSPN